MNLLVLPPKRFELGCDPVFDPIRHKPWYEKLHELRKDVPAIKLAYHLWCAGDTTQEEAAKFFGVDPKLVSDYCEFVNQIPWKVEKQEDKSHQAIINYAYEDYVKNNGVKYFDAFLQHHSKLFGVNPLGVSKRWAFDPLYWPTGYPLSIKPIQCLTSLTPASGKTSSPPFMQ